MGKHNFVMSLMRALKSPAVEKVIKRGQESLAPHYGAMVLKGGEILGRHIPGIAPLFTDVALDAYQHIPSVLKGAIDLAGGVADEWNKTTNASFVPSSVADAAPAFLGDLPGPVSGDGILKFGNDQPAGGPGGKPIVKKIPRDVAAHRKEIPVGEKTAGLGRRVDVYDKDLHPSLLLAKPAYRDSFRSRSTVPYDVKNKPEVGLFTKVGPGTEYPRGFTAPGYGDPGHRIPDEIIEGASEGPHKMKKKEKEDKLRREFEEWRLKKKSKKMTPKVAKAGGVKPTKKAKK